MNRKPDRDWRTALVLFGTLLFFAALIFVMTLVAAGPRNTAVPTAIILTPVRTPVATPATPTSQMPHSGENMAISIVSNK